ncbi:MAG: iron-sulfur cluster assembly accessory protein [Candidatus Liptonbacteria bacterium]|nr:iron-sulfur cluster assembly accessory protein [Candidatus Liptonbacteria bacterium]
MSLVVTEAALQKIKEVLTREQKQFMRIKIVGGGCSGLSYHMETADAANPHDRVGKYTLSTGGEVHLVIDRKSFVYLMGCEIDFKSTIAQSSFIFHNPNAKSSCGCGTSFSV